MKNLRFGLLIIVVVSIALGTISSAAANENLADICWVLEIDGTLPEQGWYFEKWCASTFLQIDSPKEELKNFLVKEETHYCFCEELRQRYVAPSEDQFYTFFMDVVNVWSQAPSSENFTVWFYFYEDIYNDEYITIYEGSLSGFGDYVNYCIENPIS